MSVEPKRERSQPVGLNRLVPKEGMQVFDCLFVVMENRSGRFHSGGWLAIIRRRSLHVSGGCPVCYAFEQSGGGIGTGCVWNNPLE